MPLGLGKPERSAGPRAQPPRLQYGRAGERVPARADFSGICLGMPGSVQTLEYEASPGRWRFSSATPDRSLVGIVQEYWEVEGRLAPFRERVLPNGYTELMVNLGPPHQMMTHAGTSMWECA